MGSEKGNSKLDDVRPAALQFEDDLLGGFEGGIAGSDVRNKTLARFPLERLELLLRCESISLLTQSDVPAISSATVFTSLSPRPDRFTTIICSLVIEGATLITSAIACALSSAGMIPSSRANS